MNDDKVYQVVWPDGMVYEEDGQREFSRRKAESVVTSLQGTIAGDAEVRPV